MCRLFAFSFNNTTQESDKLSYLKSFRELAHRGAVLDSTKKGHEDGWGLVVYENNTPLPVLYKSTECSLIDTDFSPTQFLKEKSSQSGLVHLRKKTVGEASIANTHPFVSGAYSFIHNGTIAHGEKEPYQELEMICDGVTDSERLFKKFIEHKEWGKVSVQDAYIKMLLETKTKYPGYSAINTILHDGDRIYVSCIINTQHPHYSQEEVEKYYTLYLGVTPHGDVIVCSEKINEESVSYKLIPNCSVCSIDLVTQKQEMVPLV
jgi:glutamine amidotransferase